MKFALSLFLMLSLALAANAQAELDFLIVDPIYNCYNCPNGNNDFKTGVKLGIGYGLVKEISSRFDVLANLGYQVWRYESISYSRYGYGVTMEKENSHFINLSVGERFHFLNKNKFSLFTGLNLNFQTYFNTWHRAVGLTAEPNIGWRQLLGNRHEFFTSVGYDQHLTSFDRYFKRHPGKLSVNVGFNFRIGKRD